MRSELQQEIINVLDNDYAEDDQRLVLQVFKWTDLKIITRKVDIKFNHFLVAIEELENKAILLLLESTIHFSVD